MKLLVTGGCGFVGSHLAADALARQDEVLVLDNLTRYGSDKNLEWLKSVGPVQFSSCDIRDSDALQKLVSDFRPDAIFHLAGQVAMTTSVTDPRLDFETNALGTLNLLDAARRHSPEAAILFSSTNKVYGDLEQFTYEERQTRKVCKECPEGFNETVPLSFSTPYGCSKGAADQYVLDYARTYDLRTAVFRHSTIYGGRQISTYDQGWIGWFCQQALNQSGGEAVDPFTVSGSGKQVRDVLHVDDVARLYRTALESIDTIKGEVFNIGGGSENSLSLLELFDLCETELGISLSYTHLPKRKSDQAVFISDLTKVKQRLGWSPKISVKDGINQVLASLKTA